MRFSVLKTPFPSVLSKLYISGYVKIPPLRYYPLPSVHTRQKNDMFSLFTKRYAYTHKTQICINKIPFSVSSLCRALPRLRTGTVGNFFWKRGLHNTLFLLHKACFNSLIYKEKMQNEKSKKNLFIFVVFYCASMDRRDDMLFNARLYYV